jgi:flagellar assembly protein FliH
MYSEVTKKSELSAFQRWELAALHEAGERDQVHIPSVHEIELLRIRAQDEGFAAGFAQGLEQGQAQATAQQQEISQRIQRIAADYELAMENLRKDACSALADLAAQIAQAVIRQELQTAPELITKVVSDMLDDLADQPCKLVVHPQDAARIKTNPTYHSEIQAKRTRIVEDDSIEPGGCRVQTPFNHNDATLAVRWQRIASAFQSRVQWQSAPESL